MVSYSLFIHAVNVISHLFIGGGHVHKNIDISISDMGYGLKAKGIIRGNHLFYTSNQVIITATILQRMK